MDEDLHKKLTDIHDEVKSIHTRHDSHDQQIGFLHYKVDRVRQGLALLFRGEMSEFVKWWNEK